MNCSPGDMSSSQISPHNGQLFAPARSACLTYSASQFVIIPWMCSLRTVVFEICPVGLVKLSVVELCILLVGFIVVHWRWSSISLCLAIVSTTSSVQLPQHKLLSLFHCPEWETADVCILIVSFPLLSNTRGNTWLIDWFYRVGCDIVEKGTGLPKFSHLQGGAAQVCWGACTQEEKQGILHSE